MDKFIVENFYSDKNQETTSAVDNFLLEHFSDNKRIKNHIKRRQETAPTKIKSFFIRIGFEIGNNGKYGWERVIPLCALCELLNLGNYLIELGIDADNQEESELGYEIRKLVLDSNFLEDYEKNVFKQMIEGIDKYLKIDNEILVWDKKFDKKKFFENYKQKCFLVGGQYYAGCLGLGYLKSKNQDTKIKDHLIKIGEIFGTAYQMLHEAADLLPESLKRFPEDFKYYQKQYNSIRKHKITLPIYFALFEWKSFNEKLFFELVGRKDYKDYNVITEMFLKEKIIKRCKTYIRKYSKTVKPEFKYLPKGEWTKCLKFAVNAVNSNIFWKHFKKLYARVA